MRHVQGAFPPCQQFTSLASLWLLFVLSCSDAPSRSGLAVACPCCLCQVLRRLGGQGGLRRTCIVCIGRAGATASRWGLSACPPPGERPLQRSLLFHLCQERSVGRRHAAPGPKKPLASPPRSRCTHMLMS